MKVLHYIYGLNIGGAESFLYNYISSLSPEECDMSFCLQSEQNDNTKLLSLINERNYNIYYIAAYNRSPIKNKNDFIRIIEKNTFDIVHFHMNSLLNYSPIKACFERGINVVVHSHNSKSNGGFLGSIIHRFNRKRINRYDFGRFACGEEAGEWFFGSKQFILINNGIDTTQYEFNDETRRRIREAYSVPENSYLIGHVGRFTYQKNHGFIIDVFSELKKKYKNIKLILIGDGELKGSIEDKIRELNLLNDVILCGNVNNVNEILSAMDVMIFPSHYEGLPFVLVEAQANGLPILASNTISESTRITDLLNFKSLTDTKESWAEEIVKLKIANYSNRLEYGKVVGDSVYDSNKTAKQVITCYRKGLEGDWQ